jgi:hypothetical protein
VGYLGRTEICAAQIETLRALPIASQLETISQTAAQSGRLRLWMTTEAALADGPAESAVRFRLHTRSSRVASLIESLDQHASFGGGVWAVGEASGIVRGAAGGEGAAVEALRQLAAAHSGSVTILHPRPAPDNPNPLSQRLKNELDPANIFGTSPKM